MHISEEDYLAHYGTLHKSGRYPWLSGGEETTASEFLSVINDMRKQGLKETDIAKGLGISTTELRARNSIAKNQQKQEDISTAQKLKDKGMSNVAIGKQMGKPESTIRALLQPGEADKADQLTMVTNRFYINKYSSLTSYIFYVLKIRVLYHIVKYKTYIEVCNVI